jgi:membrane protease YdiL (CAAX protease family)
MLPSFARTFAGERPGAVEGKPRVTATGAILAAAVATAIVFALAHVYHLPGAITVLALGLALSFILWRSGSLWVAIVSHGIYNLTVFSYVKWGMPLVEATAAGQAG